MPCAATFGGTTKLTRDTVYLQVPASSADHLCAGRARPEFVATHSTRYQHSPAYVVSDLADHSAFNQYAATVAAQRRQTRR